jgi:hypothetical protein
MPYLSNKKRPNDAYLRPLLGPNEEGGGTMKVDHWAYDELIIKRKEWSLLFELCLKHKQWALLEEYWEQVKEECEE